MCNLSTTCAFKLALQAVVKLLGMHVPGALAVLCFGNSMRAKAGMHAWQHR